MEIRKVEKEKLAENLVTLVPTIFKQLMKGFPVFELPRQHIQLLFTIGHDNGKPMSYYSEKLMMPKPNLTVIADKLIEERLIERVFDPADRRVVILKITEKGEESIREHKEKVRCDVGEKLDLLSDNDIKRLNDIIDEMKVILKKLGSK